MPSSVAMPAPARPASISEVRTGASSIESALPVAAPENDFEPQLPERVHRLQRQHHPRERADQEHDRQAAEARCTRPPRGSCAHLNGRREGATARAPSRIRWPPTISRNRISGAPVSRRPLHTALPGRGRGRRLRPALAIVVVVAVARVARRLAALLAARAPRPPRLPARPAASPSGCCSTRRSVARLAAARRSARPVVRRPDSSARPNLRGLVVGAQLRRAPTRRPRRATRRLTADPHVRARHALAHTAHHLVLGEPPPRRVLRHADRRAPRPLARAAPPRRPRSPRHVGDVGDRDVHADEPHQRARAGRGSRLQRARSRAAAARRRSRSAAPPPGSGGSRHAAP